MWVGRGVLNARRGASAETPAHGLRTEGGAVATVLQPADSHASSPRPGKITLDGDAAVLPSYAALLDEFDPNFELIAP